MANHGESWWIYCDIPMSQTIPKKNQKRCRAGSASTCGFYFSNWVTDAVTWGQKFSGDTTKQPSGYPALCVRKKNLYIRLPNRKPSENPSMDWAWTCFGVFHMPQSDYKLVDCTTNSARCRIKSRDQWLWSQSCYVNLWYVMFLDVWPTSIMYSWFSMLTYSQGQPASLAMESGNLSLEPPSFPAFWRVFPANVDQIKPFRQPIYAIYLTVFWRS